MTTPAPKDAKRDFLTLDDLSADEIRFLIDRAAVHKSERAAGRRASFRPLSGRTVGLIFQKPSTRTRVSFQVGVYELGGQIVYMQDESSRLGLREPIPHLARVLSGYLDLLVVRTFDHQDVVELAQYAAAPVINALTDDFHPCQLLSDLFTIKERLGRVEGLRIAWVGDGNNMAHSWLKAAAALDFELALAVPEGYDPDPGILADARARAARPITIVRDPREAVAGADVVNTDVWTSMGQEREAENRRRVFAPYQVNTALLAAAPKAIVLHCLPAHLGEEITGEALEGPQSAAFVQAENRLHAQKALMEFIIGPSAAGGTKS